MMKHKFLLSLIILFLIGTTSLFSQRAKHTFTLGDSEFILDGKPFRIISGELHPARIPVEYWQHRIQMAKAMGCNTIAATIFWNYHESEQGVYDFTTGNHNIAEFLKIASEEEMWVLLKPGPYVGAGWELGGLPPYLLRSSDIKLRSLDPIYIRAAERYMEKLAEEIKPYLITKGGPVIMIQIENEYGSFGNDKNYLLRLKEIWTKNGIDIPTFTADEPTEAILKAGTLPGSAVGINSGKSHEDFELASIINPGVPVFRSVTYTGSFTKWGESWVRSDTSMLLEEVKFLMDSNKSFNLHVIHGGTNFGFTSGASLIDGYKSYITSCNNDAPVDEQGNSTPKYIALRELIGSYKLKKQKLASIPEKIPSMEIPGFFLTNFTSLWDNLPQPVNSESPGSFESYGQDYGLILYTTELKGEKSGKLTVTDIHDFATVFLNGVNIGNLDRSKGINTINIPESTSEAPLLEILVEAMGRSDSGSMYDIKGITEKVTLGSEELKNWKIYNLPIDKKFIYGLRSTGKTLNKSGIFFKGNISLIRGSDTYFDVSNYSKGIVWVNGHNIGRFWNIGPQKRLFCPGSFLKQGLNEVLILDMNETQPKLIISTTTSE